MACTSDPDPGPGPGRSGGAPRAAPRRGTAEGSHDPETPAHRRLGATDSRNRARLLDAAEALMLEEGYAAVTSRRVAGRAGLKPQLVHYYFRTMDDLYLELFRRGADRGLERFTAAMARDPSLLGVWKHGTEPPGAALTIEFVALANHRKAIRAEIAAYAERFRRLQLDAVTAILEARGGAADDLPPMIVLMIMTGLTQVMAIEDLLGVTSGHRDAERYVRRFLSALEEGPTPPSGPRRRSGAP